MNNEQINNTDYYRLPCGKYLEDYIWKKRLSFAYGSALKYKYRAGKKDGESKEKDLLKYNHYVDYIVIKLVRPKWIVEETLRALLMDALKWDGE